MSTQKEAPLSSIGLPPREVGTKAVNLQVLALYIRKTLSLEIILLSVFETEAI